MTPAERDDVAHAIHQTMAFYDKELTPGQMKIWLHAVSVRDAQDVKAALLEYIKIGQYAPRPKNILELVENKRFERLRSEPVQRIENKVREAPPEVAKAWQFVIKLWGMGDMYGVSKVSPEEQDRMIELCNRQCVANGNAEAIPPEAFREDIWGMSHDEALRRQRESA